MKRSYVVPVLIVVAIAAFILYSLQGSKTDEGYLQSVEKHRTEVDQFMRSDGSPFEPDSLPFTGLKYFPVDPKYRIKARLEPVENKKVIVLATSDGLEQKYLEYAYASFEWDGQQNRLLILELMETGPQRGKLFLAFSDATSGSETYGAGRYLDVKKVPAATSVVLDFNLAYNPYCAYNDKFSCPFPPRENILQIPIKAGEMSYHP